MVVALNVLLFTSCLGSSDDDFEYSPNAQIYAISLSSSADSSSLLNATTFTIDQVNGRIFNKEPLPYLFHVDSVTISISGASTLNPFTQVSLTLEPDSTYFWSSSDSVAINRLRGITTTAPDGKTKKEYDFQLNIHQQDPYILTWEKKNDNLSSPPADQKTIAFNQRFITYYKSGTTVGAVSTNDDGTTWVTTPLTGLPPTIQLSSLLASEEAVYVLDDNGDVYQSDNVGINWSRVITDHDIKTIYGILPSANNGTILLAVDDNGTLRFALTNDFSEIQQMNSIPDELPLLNFTSTSVESADSYAAKYLVLTDGIRKDNTRNNAIWLLQEKDNEITYASEVTSAPVAGSSLFYYDNRLYLMIAPLDKKENSFLLSDNFGLNWTAAEENQAFPSNFIFRTNTSVIIDSNNIWVFGGISSTQTRIVDAWRGRINKFAMD